MTGLSLLQAPPFVIVSGFFITACLAWFLGAILEFIAFFDHKLSLPLVVHISTLGLALFTMLGALFQMLPVVAGAVIENPKPKAFLSWLLLLVGYSSFILGLFSNSYDFMLFGGLLLFVGIVYSFSLMFTKLLKLKSNIPTTRGFKFALPNLLVGSSFGLYILLAYNRFLPLQEAIIHFHLVFMLFGWIFMLVASVSFRVVEMFFVAKPYPVSFSMNFPYFFLPSLILALKDELIFKFPLFSVVLIHTILTLHRLLTSRRKSAERSYPFWIFAFLNLTIADFLFLFKHYNSFIFYYFLIAFGLFFSTLIAGMLMRIVSFLVWFHLSNEGASRVPLMAEVIEDKHVKLILILTYALAFSLYTLPASKLYILPILLHLLSSLFLSVAVIKGSYLYFKLSPLRTSKG